MAERMGFRSNPILNLLAPRSMSTAFIGILLPFVILPMLMGWLAYSTTRNSFFETSAASLVNSFEGVDAKSRIWQTDGYERVQSIGRNTDIVAAAAALESTAESKDAFFDAVYRLAPRGVMFENFFVVEAATGTIIASTQPDWEGVGLVGTSGINPAPDWSQPFSYVQVNHPLFSPSSFTVLAAAPLQTPSRQTGLVLVGILLQTELYQVVTVPLNNAAVNYIVLTFNDSSYVRVNLGEGTFTSLQFSINTSQIPSTPAKPSTYNNVLGLPVVGYTDYLNIRNIVGESGGEPSTTKILVERDQATVFAALTPLNSIFLLFGAAIAAALAIAGVQAFFFIIRPTTRLAAAVNRFAAGATDTQFPVYGTSEFVSLATSLNRLTGSLRDVTQLIGTEGQSSTRKIVVSAELVQALAGKVSVEETMRAVVDLIRDRLAFDFCGIYMVDDAGQFAVIREATDPAGEKLKASGNRFPLGSYSIIGSVAQSGRSHHTPNVSEDPMYVRNDLLPDTRSEVACPIRVNKRTIGVLDVHSNAANGFTAEDVDLIQSLADQTGSAIQNAQTLETARLSTEVSQQLYRIGRLIAVATTPEDIFKATIDGMRGTPYVVTLLQASESSLKVAGFYDPVNPESSNPPSAEIQEDPDTLARLMPSAAALIVKVESGMVRIPANIRQFLETLGCRVAAFLPLRLGERFQGAVMLSSRDENAITQTSIRPLTPVTESIISAMDRLELLRTTQSRLSELATLNRISQSVSQATDLQGLFETVHEQTRNALGNIDIIVALYDANRDLLSFPYAFLGGETVNLETSAMGDSLYALVIRNAQPLLLEENVQERAAALGVPLSGLVPQGAGAQESGGGSASGAVPRSWLGVPLITANQVVGALILLDSENENRFKDNDLRLLSTIATQIASTIRTSSLLQESERKAVQLQTAAEIARETIGLLDLDRLLSHSINLIRERFGFYHSSVFLLDDERKFAMLRESTGEAGRQMKARGHKLGVGSQSIVGWVTENARPRVADDVTADPMHRPNPLLPATRAELGIPLRIGETVIGALDVQSTLPYAFTPDDITILQVIADQIAIAVENARLFSTTREYLARHRSLYQVTTAAASSSSLDNALFSAAQGLRVTMNGSRVALFLLNPDKDTLVVRAHSGFNSREVEKMRVPLGQGVQGWVASNKQPSLVASTAADSRYLMIDSDIQSELCVPLIHRDELLGVLDIQSPHFSAFSEDDVQLLGTVASSLAAIMSSTVLFEQVTQERERLRHLYEEAIGMAGPPSGDMESLMRSALERVRSVSGADCVSIAFPSGKDEVRIEMCTCEPHLKHITGLVAHYGQDVIGEALSTNKAVTYSPASTGTLSRALAQAGIRTALALPLQWTGRTIGGLLLSRMSSDRNFSTEEVQLANLLALQVAANLESARLFDQTRRQAEREHLLFEITSRIRRSVDMQGILTTTASELSRALGARRASIKLGLADTSSPEEGDGGEDREPQG
ncbi:MAG: GAF domain-containing protein [Anaerolineales bacterium]|nr:GAF domain-containing protein [Anaerolineales bacterium]